MSNIPFKITSKPVKQALKDTKLLAPLPLYRHILRSHRQLPQDQRYLGDSYVKSEFRLHKSIDNPIQIISFLTEWQKYLEFVRRNTDQDWKKYKLNDTLLEKLSDDQVNQLWGLLKETKELYDPEAEAKAEFEQQFKDKSK
ncbi:Sdh7 protein [Martiniozyma asiatica (nom. inval.)]|nr:Sdh7 protein [Martiniozyma asiatica]